MRRPEGVRAMKEVLEVVRDVRRRIILNLLVEHFFAAAFLVASVLSAAVLAAKIVFFPRMIDYLLYGAACGTAMAAAYALAAARTRAFAAAIAADEKLGLAERLSTALAVAADASPVAQAVVEDARAAAARVKAAGQFPVSLPEKWWRLAAAIAILAAVFALPQFDAFGRRAAFLRHEKDKQEAAAEVKKFKKEIAVLKKVMANKDLQAMEAINDLESKLADIEKQGLTKKDTLAALSGPMEKLTERMKDIAKSMSKEAQANQAAQARADQKKALADAKAQLEKMTQALQKGELTKAQKDEMAKALDQLAQQMSKAPGKSAEMAQQLAKAAQDLKSGNSAQAQEAMQQAMQTAASALPGIESPLALRDKAGQQGQQSQSQVSGLSGQMTAADAAREIQTMADAMKGVGEFKQGLTGDKCMSTQEALAQLQAASARWASQAGTAAGLRPGKGGGMGGPGQGRGNVWPLGPDAGSKMASSAVGGAMHPGKMLASYYTEGSNIKNESKAELQQVVLESKQRAKDALTDQRVPRAYEKTVREYFESLDVAK